MGKQSMLCNLFRLLLSSFLLIYSKAQTKHVPQQQPTDPHPSLSNYVRSKTIQSVNPVSSPSQIINSSSSNSNSNRKKHTNNKYQNDNTQQYTHHKVPTPPLPPIYSSAETTNKNKNGRKKNNLNILKGIVDSWDVASSHNKNK